MAAGMMVDGKWKTERTGHDRSGKFKSIPTTFRDRVTADGSSGFKAESGRYHLYISLACPWAHRTLIMRNLKGLQEVIGLSIVAPLMSDKGWAFSEEPGAIPDSVNHARYLQEIYLKADPKFTGRITVPVLWDKEKGTIVNNESREIMRMFDVEFGAIAQSDLDLYPSELRAKIDETIDAIYSPINTGVYGGGFATTQEAYEEAVTELFGNLDRWKSVLSSQRYLCSNQLTEADVCLFVCDPVPIRLSVLRAFQMQSSSDCRLPQSLELSQRCLSISRHSRNLQLRLHQTRLLHGYDRD